MENIKAAVRFPAKVAGLLGLLMVGAVVLAGPSSAAGTGGGTAIGAEFTSLKSDITTIYIPGVLALVVLGIAIFMGVKWLKKGANNAS